MLTNFKGLACSAGLLLCWVCLALPAFAESGSSATARGRTSGPVTEARTSAALAASPAAMSEADLEAIQIDRAADDVETPAVPASPVAPAAPATAATVAGSAPAPASPAAPAATIAVAAPPPAPAALVAPAATVAAAPPPPAPAAALVPVATADAVVTAVRAKLADKTFAGRDNRADDVAALAAGYGARSAPLWTKDGVYTDKAKAVIAELRRAGDWGLEPADFALLDLPANAGAEAQAEAEARLALAAMKYARFARGGRLDPVSLSNILDMKPPIEDPAAVLAALVASSAPDATLRGYHPKHAGFERLRQALLKARGPQVDVEKIDPALLVKLKDGKTLKPGAADDQVALLRQRLKQPAEDADTERRYDELLVAAVKEFQGANGLKANGLLTNRTRQALNKEGEPKAAADPKQKIDRLVANLERWRWLPTDLGPFFVMNNIPEFQSEIWKGSELKLRQKMIVGMPSWPTPVLQASMEFVIFHPSWGVPPGIMAKELQPRLRQASGDGFFSQLFGGSSGGAEVLEAYKLKVTQNGKPVDPNSVDWGNVDIRKYGFSQPAGATNPLGLVKFRFPNSHNVYMHDTPQRNLFGQSQRALSHGCMRVGEPRRTAEVILEEDQGMTAERVGGYWKSGGSVTLDKQVPVYLVYFTARVDDDGRLQTFGDIYGHDGRVMAALRGKAVRQVAPQAVDPSEAAEEGTVVRKGKKRAG